MVMKRLILALALCPLSASASTLSFGGNTYADSFDTSYFFNNPTTVGQSSTYRFYDDFCAHKVKSFGGFDTLLSCALDDYGLANSGTFFSLTLDGSSGLSSETQTYFFTVTFTPTKYVNGATASSSDYNLINNVLDYSLHWHSIYSGNNNDVMYSFDGTVAPVPLPAAGSLLAAGVAFLSYLRRRNNARTG